MILPADLVCWTSFSENIFTEFGLEIFKKLPVNNKTLRITGTASEKFKRNMVRLGITFRERADEILEMMD